MILETIRETLKNKRCYDAERKFLHDCACNHRCKLNDKQKERMLFLVGQLTCIQTWLTLLTEDEAYVIERHLIDGVDIPRVAAEYQKRWGEEYAKTERTLKSYQRRAIEKIAKFEEAKQLWIAEDN